MIRPLVATLVATLALALLFLGPDQGPRNCFPVLPLAVLPGMMRSEVAPRLQAAQLTIDVQDRRRIEAVSEDRRTRFVVVLSKAGQVVSVATRRVADLTQLENSERAILAEMKRAGWATAPSGGSDRRFVHGSREVLVRRLFECDSLTPTECYYAVLEAHDRHRDPLGYLRP